MGIPTLPLLILCRGQEVDLCPSQGPQFDPETGPGLVKGSGQGPRIGLGPGQGANDSRYVSECYLQQLHFTLGYYK